MVLCQTYFQRYNGASAAYSEALAIHYYFFLTSKSDVFMRETKSSKVGDRMRESERDRQRKKEKEK